MNVVYEKKFALGQYLVYDEKPNFPFIEVKQTHSNLLIEAREASLSKDLLVGDGLWSNLHSICQGQQSPWAIKTADCIPVLMFGNLGCAFIHAGWRGVHNRITLQETLIRLEIHSVFLGPHIQEESFEVQEDFFQYFPLENHRHLYTQKQNQKMNQNMYTFNLSKKLQEDLLAYYPQLKVSQFENSHIDTFSDPKFHSYRRDKTTLRNWHIFRFLP